MRLGLPLKVRNGVILYSSNLCDWLIIKSKPMGPRTLKQFRRSTRISPHEKQDSERNPNSTVEGLGFNRNAAHYTHMLACHGGAHTHGASFHEKIWKVVISDEYSRNKIKSLGKLY